jgi:hypothetical protein
MVSRAGDEPVSLPLAGGVASVRFRTAGLQSYSMKCADIFLTLVFGSIAP